MTLQFNDVEIQLIEHLISLGNVWVIVPPKNGRKPDSLMDEVAKILGIPPEAIVDIFYTFENDFNFLTHSWERRASSGMRGHAQSPRDRPNPDEWNLKRVCLLQSGVTAYERFMHDNEKVPVQWRPLPKAATPARRLGKPVPRVWENLPERPATPSPAEPTSRRTDRIDNGPRMSTGKTVRPNAPASGPRPMRPRAAPPLEIRLPGRPKKEAEVANTPVSPPARRKPGRPLKNPLVVRRAPSPEQAESLPPLLVPADAPYPWFVLALVEARPIIYSEDAVELLLELVAMRRELPPDRTEARVALLEVLDRLEEERHIQIYRHYSGSKIRQVRIRLGGQEALAGYQGLIAKTAQEPPAPTSAPVASSPPAGQSAYSQMQLPPRAPYPMLVLAVIQQIGGIRSDLDASVSLYQHVELAGRHMASSQAVELQMLRKIVTNLYVSHHLVLEYQGFTIVSIQVTDAGRAALAAHLGTHPVAETVSAD